MWTSIIIGFFGGLTLNILNLLELQNVPPQNRPNFKDLFYWLPYIIWPLLGGLLVYLYESSGTQLNSLIAFQVGLTAPLIIKALISAVPKQIPTITSPQGA
jgi:hypothetical protein